MQSQPLVTVKKAAALLGLQKDELRQRLIDGAVKGEQRKVGDKDKWFIYSGELDNLLTAKFSSISARPNQSEAAGHAERVTLSGIEDFFEASEGSSEVQISRQERGSDALCLEPSAAQHDEPAKFAAVESIDATFVEAEQFEVYGDLENGDFGSTAVAFEEAVQSLSLQFAYRLASERHSLMKLEHELQEEKALSLKVAPLERALQLEVRSNCLKSVAIEKLQQEIAFLSAQLASKQKPWWQRPFGR